VKIIDGESTKQFDVWGNKTGHRFDRIELDATDFYRLSQLSPERLHDWLTEWQCGFKPPSK
jgi:hypothetical protein